MLVVHSKNFCEAVLVHCLSSAKGSIKEESLTLASVSAEVNDLWFVSQQQSLQIDWLYSAVVMQFESIAVATFVNSLIDFSSFFSHQNSAGTPWIRRYN